MVDKKELEFNYRNALGFGLSAGLFVRELANGNYTKDSDSKKVLRMIKHARKAYGVNANCIAFADIDGVTVFAFDYKKDGKRVVRYTTVDDNKTVEFMI